MFISALTAGDQRMATGLRVYPNPTHLSTYQTRIHTQFQNVQDSPTTPGTISLLSHRWQLCFKVTVC